MSEKKLSLDETVDGWDEHQNHGSEQSSSFVPPSNSSGGLLGALGYNADSFDESSGFADDDFVGEEFVTPPESEIPVSQSVDVPEEMFDADLDFEPGGSVVGLQPVNSADNLKDLFEQQEKIGDVSPAAKQVVSEPVKEIPQVSSEYVSMKDDDLGHVPENVVKPIRVIDVVRKGREASNKALNKKGGSSVGSGKKKGSKGESEPSETVRMCHVKGIPRPLMDAIMLDFKSETPKSQADALVAWIVCHCEEDKILRIAPYLTDYQVGLIEGWENTPNSAIQQKLDAVTKRLQNLAIDMDTLKLLAAYETFDRLGFRKESSMIPRNVNLMENGVLDVVMRAEEQTTQLRNDRGLQKGRPIK